MKAVATFWNLNFNQIWWVPGQVTVEYGVNVFAIEKLGEPDRQARVSRRANAN